MATKPLTFFSRRIHFHRLASCALLAVALGNWPSQPELLADEPPRSANPATSSRGELVPEPPKKPSLPADEPPFAAPDRPAAAPPAAQHAAASPAEQEIAALCQSAAAREQAGQFAEAESLYEKALASAQKLRGKDHLDCGVILARIAMLDYAAKQYYKSADRFSDAVFIFRQHLPRDNPQYTFLVNEFARALARLNKHKEAAELNAANVRVREASLGKKHIATLLSLHNLGLNYGDMGRWQDAVTTLEEWLARDEDGKSAKSLGMPEALQYLGTAHAQLHHYDRAVSCFKRQLTLLEAESKRDYLREVRVLEQLVQTCGHEHEKGVDDAHRFGEQCLKLCREQFGPEHKETINAIGVLGIAYYKVGDDDGGARLLRDFVQLEKKIGEQDSDDYWAGVLHLAHVEFRLGRFEQGAALTWSALSAMEARLGNHRNYGAWWESLADVLPEAAPHLARREELDERLRGFVAGVEKLAGADDSDTAQALTFVAAVYLRIESWEQCRQYGLRALAIERQLAATNPLTLATTLHQLGLAARKQERYAEAEAYLLESAQIRGKKIGREDGWVAGTLCHLGYVYAKTGRYMEAEATLRNVLALAEKFGSPSLAKEAEGYLELLHKDPKAAGASTTQAALAKAKSLLARGEWDQAIIFYDEAIRVGPKTCAMHSSRGFAYQQKGNAAEALADYNEAIRLDPNNVSAFYGRSNVHHSLRDLPNAIADLDRAIQISPAKAMLYWSRAVRLQEKPDYPAAIADATKAIALEPKEERYVVYRGYLYRLSGEYDNAIADYDRLIATDPECADAYMGRYGAYLKKGEKEKASADFDRAMELSAKRKKLQGAPPKQTGSGG